MEGYDGWLSLVLLVFLVTRWEMASPSSCAASRPPAQCGMKTSAGLRLVPGISARPSLVGASPAAAAVSCRASHRNTI